MISTVALQHELALLRERLDYLYFAGDLRWFDVLLGLLIICSLRLMEEYGSLIKIGLIRVIDEVAIAYQSVV